MNAKKVKHMRRVFRSFGIDVRQRTYVETNVRRKYVTVLQVGVNGATAPAKVEFLTTTVKLGECGRKLYQTAKATER